MVKLEDEIKSGKLQLLLDSGSIQSRVRGLAKEICSFYEWEKDELIVIGLADGANIFVSDLIRLLPFKLRLYFLKIKSYEGMDKVKNSVINIEELTDIENKNILIIDDICDTSETLYSIVEKIKILKPKTIKTIVLLNKNIKKQFDIKLDFVGFNIPDKWAVGYGMDTDQYYRNLNEICVLNNG